MNNYFTNIATSLHNSIPNTNTNFSELISDKTIYLKQCTEEELYKIIFFCKKANSASDDIITIKDVQSVYEIIKDKLLKSINDVIKYGNFPDCRKISRIVPIFKKGQKNKSRKP